MQIVTGRRGEPHVTSRQMQAVYRSFLGDFALLDIGEKLRAEAYSDDIVRVYDGVVSVQGIYAVIAYNQYDEVYIEPVSVGKKRIDTIVLHYTKDNTLDVEDMQLDVVQGEEYTDNPIAPAVPEGGDAWEGTTDIQVPIYDIEVTNFGLTVTPYARMLTVIPTLDSIAERIPETVVTGVKGDSEVLYRDGDVNITKANIGLGNVDNTADTDKPISTATQTALNLKADLTYVDAKISAAYHAGGSKTVADLTSALLIADNIGKVYNMSDSGVTTSDFVEGAGEPINEGDNVGICNVGTEENPVYKFDLLSGFVDLSAYYTKTESDNKYVAKETGKGLSTNDYTTADKNKLAGIEAEANKTVVDSSMSDSSTNPLQNKVITKELEGAKTATGSLITLTDASNTSLIECVAIISSSTSSVTITVKDTPTNPTVTNTYTIDLGQTVSSGTLDVVKGTLTTGGTIYNLPPTQIKLLKGNNVISSNVSSLSIKYQPDNALGDLKADIESEYNARLERLEQYTDVFGFIEDMDVLSPTERIKYIGKNENYEPLTVDLNTGSYTLGDWGNFPFLVDNKPYMVKPDGTPDYQLNEYDYTKKLDGTDSDVANEDYDGGAFSWGRKIYKKQWMVGNKRYVLYSFDKKDGFHADGFINKDGKELDGRWIPMFYGTVVDGKAKSIATGNCISGGNITTDAQHNAIIAFDSNANFFGGAFVETLIDLLMMFAKNSDLQAAYGYGNSSGYVNDSSKNYGMLNNAVVNGGQFYGRSGGKTLNKALHSIVLATYNSYMRDPYEVIKNGKVVVSEDYTYDPTGATYTDTGITVPNQSSNAWRYPKKYIAVPRYGSIPDISVGGASTSLGRADGTYTLANQSWAVIVCQRFSSCIDGANAGLSCRAWYNTASIARWIDGFALLLDGSVVA